MEKPVQHFEKSFLHSLRKPETKIVSPKNKCLQLSWILLKVKNNEILKELCAKCFCDVVPHNLKAHSKYYAALYVLQQKYSNIQKGTERKPPPQNETENKTENNCGKSKIPLKTSSKESINNSTKTRIISRAENYMEEETQENNPAKNKKTEEQRIAGIHEKEKKSVQGKIVLKILQVQQENQVNQQLYQVTA